MAKTAESPASRAGRRPRHAPPLGPLSYRIMCVLHKLPKPERYGSIVEQELKTMHDEPIDFSQVYIALQRLLGRSLLKIDPSTALDTKHTVVLYTITPDGYAELKRAITFYTALAKAAPKL